MLKSTLPNSVIGAQSGQVVFGRSVAKNARTANRILDFLKASTNSRTHYPSAFLANDTGAPGLSMIPSETRNDPQPTKRNRFDSRSPFAPEIAARTPPSVPWTFPCLCVGFTSFLSTALLPPLEARLRSFAPVSCTRQAAHPHPRHLPTAARAQDLQLLCCFFFPEDSSLPSKNLLQLSPDAAVLP
jgi:hypothetical protein